MFDESTLSEEDINERHEEVLRNIFASLDSENAGRIGTQPLMKGLETLGMEEEDLRNFAERCNVMEQETVDVEEFIEFFLGESNMDDETESPAISRRTSRADEPSARPVVPSDEDMPTKLAPTTRRGSKRMVSHARVKSISRMAQSTKDHAVVRSTSRLPKAMTDQLLHLVRSNKMKRARIEKAQTLLNGVQHRLEVLQDQLIAADEGEMSHEMQEKIRIRRNNELMAKLNRLTASVEELTKQRETLDEELTLQKGSIGRLEKEVAVAKQSRAELQQQQSVLVEATKEKQDQTDTERIRNAKQELSLLEAMLDNRTQEVEAMKAKILKQHKDMEQLRKQLRDNTETKKSLEDTLIQITKARPSPRRRTRRASSAFSNKDVNPNVKLLRTQAAKICKKIAQVEGIENEEIRDQFAGELLAELKGLEQEIKPNVLTPRRYSDIQRQTSMAKFKKLMVKKLAKVDLQTMSTTLVEQDENSTDEESDEVPAPAEDALPVNMNMRLTKEDTKDLLSQLLRQAVTAAAMESAKREDEINKGRSLNAGDKNTERPQIEEGGFFCARCDYANAFFRLTCRQCQFRRFKYIGGIERARLATRANYVHEKLVQAGKHRFHLATKKGMQWQIREYIIQPDSLACDITTAPTISWSPANVHSAIKKAEQAGLSKSTKSRRSQGGDEPQLRFKRLRYRFMVDIRCHKRTVEIAISPNIPPSLMRLMLLSQFERKLEAFKRQNTASAGKLLPTPEAHKKTQNGRMSPPSGEELEDEGDMVSRMPNLEDYGEVLTKRYKADNEQVAEQCVKAMTRARDCWAAQEFLKREEHERLTNCALWLDIIFKRYKEILEEILRNEDDGKRVLLAEARIVRDKRFKGMGLRRKKGQAPYPDNTIDPCDTALAEAKIINMLQEATESRGGSKFDQVYPPYMDHDYEDVSVHELTSQTTRTPTPTKSRNRVNQLKVEAALREPQTNPAPAPAVATPRSDDDTPPMQSTDTPRSALVNAALAHSGLLSAKKTDSGKTPTANRVKSARSSSGLAALEKMTVRGVMANVRKGIREQRNSGSPTHTSANGADKQKLSE